MRLVVGLLLLALTANAESYHEWILTPKTRNTSLGRLKKFLPIDAEIIRSFGPGKKHLLVKFRKASRVRLSQFSSQPNFTYKELLVDPAFSESWAFQNQGEPVGGSETGIMGADISALKAWKITEGSPQIIVAVLDSGITLGHEDLKEGIWKNSREIAANGKDDDGNGYVDDVRGWNFVEANSDIADHRGHGTFCAGLIVADKNNGKGSRGLAPLSKVMPLKIVSDAGAATTATAVEAIDYAVAAGAKILSLSWGGRDEDPLLFEALRRASDKGVLIVAASGNDGINNDRDFKPTYPASYSLPTLIAVAAYDNRDKMTDFSSYGRKTVHLGAPGQEIFSTTLTGYGFKNGTSFAAPLVAGTAALVLSVLPQLGAENLKSRILGSTDPLSYYERWKTQTGGRLNAYQAIQGIFPEHPAEPEKWRRLPIGFSSPHPYQNNSKIRFEIHHPGAKNIRVHFSKFDLEPDYDTLTLRDSSGRLVYAHSGNLGENVSADALGETLVIEFESDFVRTSYGFDIDAYEIAE